MEEWIEHHLMLGVDKIYLYDNGFTTKTTDANRVRNRRKRKDVNKGTRWAKKPSADYFLDHTNGEVMNKLREDLDKFGDRVELISYVFGKDHQTKYPHSQFTGYRHCVENNNSDWWICIDPDEYLFSEKHDNIKDFIQVCEKRKRYSLRLKQRVFNSRTREKKTREIFEWGYDFPDPKSIVKSPIEWEGWPKSHHWTLSQLGGVHKVPFDEFRLNHYRGAGMGGYAHKRHIRKLAQRHGKGYVAFDKIDKGMEKFL